MILNKNYRGAAAVARFVLGVVLLFLSAWLIYTNVSLSDFGVVGAFDGSVSVVWEGAFPTLIGVDANTVIGVAAGALLGLLVTVVEILIWNGDINWARADWQVKAILFSIVIYDAASTVWGLTNGVFLVDYSVASFLRLAMAIALTLFAFSIGAERWGVLGWQLVAYNAAETVRTLDRALTTLLAPRQPDQKPKGENVHMPPTNGAPYPQQQHGGPPSPEEIARRKAQAERERQRIQQGLPPVRGGK